MKKGRSLIGIAEEIQRQADNKRDFITPATQLRFATELESLGGAVIELKPSEWRTLSASK